MLHCNFYTYRTCHFALIVHNDTSTQRSSKNVTSINRRLNLEDNAFNIKLVAVNTHYISKVSFCKIYKF